MSTTRRLPIPARPKVRHHSILPVVGSLTSSHAGPMNAQNSADQDTAALVRKADQELHDLLAKLQPPPRPLPPHRGFVKSDNTHPPEVEKAPAPDSGPDYADTVAGQGSSANTTTEIAIEKHSPPLLIGAAIMLSAVALFSSILVYHLHDGQLTSQAKELTLQRNTVSKLALDVRAQGVETATRLAALQRLVAEVKYPPPAFDEAQNLVRAGRYADAEAAYHAFLLRSPDSRVADVALHNAAVASAMRNNCAMSATYLIRLKKQFPESPLLIQSKNLVSQCNALRTKAF
jgi:TolA-binding protein